MVHTPLEQVSPLRQQSAAVPHDSPVSEQAPQAPLERQMVPEQQGSLLAHVEPDAMQQPESLTACGYVPEQDTGQPPGLAVPQE